MKRVVKSLIFFFLYYSGINNIVSLLFKRKIYILNFHSITSDKYNKELRSDLYPNLSFDAENFERRLVYLLKKGHTFFKFGDLDYSKIKNVSKPTSIYFDDGFKDNLLNALPILQKYDIPATLFVATDIVDRQTILWTIKQRQYLQERGWNKEDIEADIRLLKKRRDEDRNIDLAKLYADDKFGFDMSASKIFLSWDDLRELVKYNFEIGSHGKAHKNLTLCDSDQLLNELQTSKERIESELGVEVASLSFPYGRYNKEVLRVAAGVGYKRLVSTGVGLNSLAEVNERPLKLRNVAVNPEDSMIAFKINLYSGNVLKKYDH